MKEMSYCWWGWDEVTGCCGSGGEEWVDWRGCGLSSRFYDGPFIWLGIIIGYTRGRAFAYESVSALYSNETWGHTAHPASCMNMKSKSLEHEDSRVTHSFDGV